MARKIKSSVPELVIRCLQTGGMITTSPDFTFLGWESPISTIPTPDNMQYLSVVSLNLCHRVVIPGSTLALAIDKSGSDNVLESSVM